MLCDEFGGAGDYLAGSCFSLFCGGARRQGRRGEKRLTAMQEKDSLVPADRLCCGDEQCLSERVQRRVVDSDDHASRGGLSMR